MFLFFFLSLNIPRFPSLGLCLMAPSLLVRCCQAWCGPPVSMPAELSSPGWLSTRACILYSSCLCFTSCSPSHTRMTHHGNAAIKNVTFDDPYSWSSWDREHPSCELFGLDSVGVLFTSPEFSAPPVSHLSKFTETCGVLVMSANVHSWVLTLILMGCLIYIQLSEPGASWVVAWGCCG